MTNPAQDMYRKAPASHIGLISETEQRKRRQLFEIGDQVWLPDFVRDGFRAFLNGAHRVMGYHKAWAKILAPVLAQTDQKEIVILGGGGLVFCQLLQKELRLQHNLEVKFFLTDLYPVNGIEKDLHPEDNIVCVNEPVNMLDVPIRFKGLRLIVNAFHHLTPEQGQLALQDAFDKNIPICICEYTRNSMVSLLSSALYPFFNLLIFPFIKPKKISTFFLTYIIPFFPLAIAFDGLMSNLRSYSQSEFMMMTSSLCRAGYQWHCKETTIPLHPTVLTTFLGIADSR